MLKQEFTVKGVKRLSYLRSLIVYAGIENNSLFCYGLVDIISFEYMKMELPSFMFFLFSNKNTSSV